MCRVTGVLHTIGAVNKNGNCYVPDMECAEKILEQLREKGYLAWIEDNCIMVRVLVSEEDYWKMQEKVMELGTEAFIEAGGQVKKCEVEKVK